MRKLMLITVIALIATFAVAAPAMAQDRDCADFASQAEAQAYFEANGGSPTNNFNNLDADNDGIACEDHQYSGGTSTDTGGATQLPSTGSGGVLTGDSMLLSPVVLLAGALVLGIALVSGSMVVRRSTR